MATQAQGAQTQQAQDTRQKYTLKQAAGKSRYEIGPGQRVETATAGVQAFVRLGSAAFVSGNIASFRKRPQQPIELYEFEACPFCRKVREACTILDIDVKFYPCPKDGPTFRPKAIQMSGKSQFPFMVDPNNGNKQLLESDAIIKYLVEEYGDGRVPWQLNLGPLTSISCGFAMLPRVGRGAQYRKSRIPDKPIELWAYEASPFCKLTRERLVELEIPHIYHTVARNSPKRQALIDKWGVFQVPYIEDPNTGVAMFETPKINEYLEATYAV
jgi:glutathione S-transferase